LLDETTEELSLELVGGLPDENFNKKPNSAKRGQTDCLRARKKKLYLRYCHSFVTKKHLNYKNIKRMSSKLR